MLQAQATGESVVQGLMGAAVTVSDHPSQPLQLHSQVWKRIHTA